MLNSVGYKSSVMSKQRRSPRPPARPAAPAGGPRSLTVDTPLLRQARQLWSQSRWDEALQHFDQAVAAAPNNVRALVDAARAFGARYQFDRAESLLRCLLEQQGNNPAIQAHAGE